MKFRRRLCVGVAIMSDDLAKALAKAALARALKDDDPLREIASRLDMTTADVLRLAAAMIERPFFLTTEPNMDETNQPEAPAPRPGGRFRLSRDGLERAGASRRREFCNTFEGKADMAFCGNSLSRSLSGVERTSLFAAQMSAYDPKRT
jgi:hypothetical protein